MIIAEAFDQSVNGDDFFEILKNDWVTKNDLDNLLDFCPCRLSVNPGEQNSLIDFLFSRIEVFQHPLWENRRKSLTSILDFIERSNNLGLEMKIDSTGVHNFLGSAYSSAFHNQILWTDELEPKSETRILWRQYYAGELLSYAVQALFWAGLTKLNEDERIVLSSKDYGFWFGEVFGSSLPEFVGNNFTEIVDEITLNLPEITDRNSPNHEIYLTRQLEQTVKDKWSPNRQEKTVGLATQILLTLAARFVNDNLDFPVSFTNQQLNEYPINLTNFIYNAGNDWRTMKLNEWLGWLATKWGVETHLMIALRKLQQESLDTFKVFPSEEGLQVKEFIGDKTIEEILMPGFTSPRLRTTLQILLDLGLLTIENESLILTPTGKNLLEEITYG